MPKFDYALDENDSILNAEEAISGKLYKCPVCYKKILIKVRSHVSRNVAVRPFFRTMKNQEHLEGCDLSQFNITNYYLNEDAPKIKHPQLETNQQFPTNIVNGHNNSHQYSPPRLSIIREIIKRNPENVIVQGDIMSLNTFLANYFVIYKNIEQLRARPSKYYFIGQVSNKENPDWDEITLSKHFTIPFIRIDKKDGLREEEYVIGYIDVSIKPYNGFYDFRGCPYTFQRLQDYNEFLNFMDKIGLAIDDN